MLTGQKMKILAFQPLYHFLYQNNIRLLKQQKYLHHVEPDWHKYICIYSIRLDMLNLLTR